MKTHVFRLVVAVMLLLVVTQTLSLAQKNIKQYARSTPATEIKSVGSFEELAMEPVDFVTSDFLVTPDSRPEKEAKLHDKDKMKFKNVEAYPAPENGVDLDATLKGLIKYPQCAIEKDIEGVVKVLCTVEKDGSVSNVLILNDIGGNCAQEVCRVIRSVRFKPAMQNGYPRRCNMVIPVVFELI
jgi:TonB family protein